LLGIVLDIRFLRYVKEFRMNEKDELVRDLEERNRIIELIKEFEHQQGNGDTLISVFISPSYQMERIRKMLSPDYVHVCCIRSRVKRLTIMAALASAVEELKAYDTIPRNGLVIYSGTLVDSTGTPLQKIKISLEPFRTIKNSDVLIENKFNTQPLLEMVGQNY